MASPKTLKLRRESGRREQIVERTVRRAVDEALWVDARMRTPEAIAHTKACREEMEQIQGK